MALTTGQKRLLQEYDPALYEVGLGDLISDIEAGVPADTSVTDTKMATDVKIGSVANLTTTSKTNLVGAINEVDAHADAIIAGSGILKAASIKVNADSPVTVTAAMSGTVFSNKGATGAVTFNLPTAAAGLYYTFVKFAAQDILIQAAAGDCIHSGTAAKIYQNVTGEIANCTIHAIDATDWEVIAEKGTWANNNA
jgi:hypothetical protein